MMHPDTILRHVNDESGYGVFATAFIPKGTIVFVKDELDIEITPQSYKSLSEDYRKFVDKYSYIDRKGVRVLCWDHAKYVNHCCNCNTISTGYGFEIAITDIHPNEEITDEYGLFNLRMEMHLLCKRKDCRKRLQVNEFDHHFVEWDKKVEDALQHLHSVTQPLLKYLDSDTHKDVLRYLNGNSSLKSVLELKYKKYLHGGKRLAVVTE